MHEIAEYYEALEKVPATINIELKRSVDLPRLQRFQAIVGATDVEIGTVHYCDSDSDVRLDLYFNNVNQPDTAVEDRERRPELAEAFREGLGL